MSVEQVPHQVSRFGEPVLHVDLLAGLSRKRGEQCDVARLVPCLEVVPVEVVLVAAAAAKVEDHASALAATASSTQLALLDERAERREARARADHDDGCGVRGRQPEVGVLVDVDVRDVADGQALAHKSGADADAVDTVCRVLDLCNRRLHRLCVFQRARRDGVKARLQRTQRSQQRAGGERCTARQQRPEDVCDVTALHVARARIVGVWDLCGVGARSLERREQAVRARLPKVKALGKRLSQRHRRARCRRVGTVLRVVVARHWHCRAAVQPPRRRQQLLHHLFGVGRVDAQRVSGHV
mmetsp:Transcript_33019/g.98280  ORF Transcript_33019/g.98280 Transcript_33019/m.98280 type:complete len:299 (-) Transcript_33019:1287-2183(-)